MVAPGGGPWCTACSPWGSGVSTPPPLVPIAPLLHDGLHLLVLVPAPQHQALQLAACWGVA